MSAGVFPKVAVAPMNLPRETMSFTELMLKATKVSIPSASRGQLPRCSHWGSSANPIRLCLQLTCRKSRQAIWIANIVPLI